ncbi:unnamed protein product [Linum trigynum]|uniref:F-box domain-containing protein n=1 Tax=Linum trigynum TaxID=586398 RepID=A0AAV2DQB7_9ROSI
MAEKDSKQAKISDHEEQVDRLSALPDEILHQILYRFATKFAGTTSVLSSRWRSLWKSAPFLNLDSDPYRGSKSGNSDFENFVGTVLSLRDRVADVDSFRFVYVFPLRRRTDCDPLNSAIDYAVAHKVKYCLLYLRAAQGNLSIFPQSIFLCKSLKILRLRGGYGAFRFKPSKLAKALSASNLKTLYLDYCKFKGCQGMNVRTFRSRTFGSIPLKQGSGLRFVLQS